MAAETTSGPLFHTISPNAKRPTRLALDLVDLPLAVVDKVVVALHELLELLLIIGGASWIRHHALELAEVGHLHLGDDRPVLLGAEIGHNAHARHADLLAQLRHLEKLVDHRAHLPRLAIHNLANNEHWTLQVGSRR